MISTTFPAINNAHETMKTFQLDKNVHQISTEQASLDKVVMGALNNKQIIQNSYAFKFLILGDSGVGKTCILMRYCQDLFQQEFLSTIGVDFRSKRLVIQNSQAKLRIWDTAGQQRFKNITKNFYKGSDGVVLVYSITDQTSFQHIESWITQIKQNLRQQISMVLIGSKKDLQQNRKVTKQQGQKLAQKYKIPFLQVSAKYNEGISQSFCTLTKLVISSYKCRKQAKNNIGKKLSHLLIDKNNNKKATCC